MKIEKIEIVNIDRLSLEINTVKEHPDWQVEQIANSIQEFGFIDPVGIDEDNFVIEGKGRILAAKKLGINEIPCIRLIGLTEEQKRAYIIAHNKLTINTGFDLDALEYEINALKIENFDLSLTGFDEYDLESFENSEIDFKEFISEEEKKDRKKIKLCPHCGGEL